MIRIPLKDTLFEIYESLNWMQGLAPDAYTSVYSRFVLEVMIQEDIPFYADLNEIKIIFEKLISYFIRFQDVSKLNRHISIKGKTDVDKLTIHISDNSIGIPIDSLADAFDFEHSIPLNRSNTLPGLNEAQEAMTKMNGKIEIPSEKGNGTHFLIFIPNHIPPSVH